MPSNSPCSLPIVTSRAGPGGERRAGPGSPAGARERAGSSARAVPRRLAGARERAGRRAGARVRAESRELLRRPQYLALPGQPGRAGLSDRVAA